MGDASRGIFGRLVDRTTMALRDIAARQALRQELLECDRSGVLNNILADINLSRGELQPLIANYPLSIRLFGSMAARLGVDPAWEGPAMRRGLQRNCALCAHQDACQHWLDSGRSEDYEEFCPNADYWRALKARIAAAASQNIFIA